MYVTFLNFYLRGIQGCKPCPLVLTIQLFKTSHKPPQEIPNSTPDVRKGSNTYSYNVVRYVQME